MSQDLINSIRDLKSKSPKVKIQEVKVRHPNPQELLSELMVEIENYGHSGRFENTHHLRDYLRYLLETRHRREHERTYERDIISLRCNCGTVHKLTISPAPREELTHFWERHHTTIQENVCGFYCSKCGIQIRTRARMIHRVETQEIEKPPIEYDIRDKIKDWEF